MRHVYFSPHLDDAVLSAGGLIYDQVQAGHPVEIWTFMAGFPRDDELSDYAKTTLRSWGMTGGEEAIRIRREEDKKAAGQLGARAVHYDFLDCVFRRNRRGEVLYQDVFEPPNQAEADLPAQIAQTMVAWLAPRDVVYCQLGIGSHIDHITVRKAAEMLGRPLIFTPDVPYFLREPGELTSKTAHMKEIFQPVTEAGVQAWLSAIEVYATQMATLFGRLDKMRSEVYSYWKDRKGIRLWKFD